LHCDCEPSMDVFIHMYIDCFLTCLAALAESAKFLLEAWSTYVVVSSPPSTEETGAMGHEIESRPVYICRVVALIKMKAVCLPMQQTADLTCTKCYYMAGVTCRIPKITNGTFYICTLKRQAYFKSMFSLAFYHCSANSLTFKDEIFLHFVHIFCENGYK
jgi:hypothetical protein